MFGTSEDKKPRIGGEQSKNVIAEAWLEPIRNPVTGKAHRAIIEIPEGFESSRMDQASMKTLVVNDGYLPSDMKEHMVVFQKTLGKDLDARYCMNCMSVVEDISSLDFASLIE